MPEQVRTTSQWYDFARNLAVKDKMARRFAEEMQDVETKPVHLTEARHKLREWLVREAAEIRTVQELLGW